MLLFRSNFSPRASNARGSRQMCIKTILLLLTLLVFPLSAPAQEKQDEAAPGTTAGRDSGEVKQDHSFQEVVVTATRTEKSIADVPAAVSVVTKENIENRNIQKIDEAIDLVPGLFDKRSKGLDTTGRVILRGMPDQKRTLVLLDGEPLNNGYTGLVDWNTVSPEDVERIEVARGPFSSLYGGNAMGGVINIITKMPEKREVTMKSGYGSNDLWTAYGSYGDKLFDSLHVFASYGYKNSNGYPTDLTIAKPGTAHTGTPVSGGILTTDTSGTPSYIIGDKGDNHWWTESGNIKFQYDLSSETKAFFSYRNNQYGYGYDNPHSFLTDSSGNSVWSGAVNIAGGRYSLSESSFLNGGGGAREDLYNGGFETHLFDDAVLKVSGGFFDMSGNWYITPTSGTATRSGGPGKISETPSQMYYADMQLSMPVLEKHMLTVGAAFRYDEADNQEHNVTDWTDSLSKTNLTYEAKGKDDLFSLYSQAEIALLRDVTLYAGVRGDYWETYDGMANQVGSVNYPEYYGSKSEFSINPKGSVVYKPLDTTTFRASIGTSFRPPNVYELYRTWVSTTGVTYQGNPSLDPETAFSWDVGVEQKMGSSTVMKLTWFDNIIHDFIYLQSINSKLQVQTNAGKAETQGFELEMETKPADWLKLFSGATYTRSEVLENTANPLSVGKQLIGVPEWMFNLGSEVTWRKFSFTLIGRYASKQYGNDQNTDSTSGVYGSYDSFFLADFYARYKVNQYATLDFAVSNMLDKDYFSYYKAPGREFFGGLTVKF